MVKDVMRKNLSATGSRMLPKSVISFLILAMRPSKKSVTDATKKIIKA
jgi:hypothetical protein